MIGYAQYVVKEKICLKYMNNINNMNKKISTNKHK